MGVRLLCFRGKRLEVKEGTEGAVGRYKGGDSGREGWRDSGFPVLGVGFLCVRTQGPWGRHLQARLTTRAAPPCVEPRPRPTPQPVRHLQQKEGGAGSASKTPRNPAKGYTAPRPHGALLGLGVRPHHCPLPHPGLIVLFYVGGGGWQGSVLTFFFWKLRCIG